MGSPSPVTLGALREVFYGRAVREQVRLHPFLKLPAYGDNLETRLLMPQWRLDEKALALRLHREQRGRLRIECDLRIELERVAI
jgi:hypothetical protein